MADTHPGSGAAADSNETRPQHCALRASVLTTIMSAPSGDFEDPLHVTAWTNALEFLSAEDVVHKKSVSKGMRSAARIALTRGRHRPVTRCIQLVRRLGNIPGVERCDAFDSFTEGDKANIRAAWALDPSLVGEAVVWYNMRSHRPSIVDFLLLFEPSLDGFERIVAAMEHSVVGRFFDYPFWTWFIKVGRGAPGGRLEDTAPFTRTQDVEGFEQMSARLWRAVKSWRDPHNAFRALYAASCGHMARQYREYPFFARTMTADWDSLEGQAKRGVIITLFREHVEEVDANLSGGGADEFPMPHIVKGGAFNTRRF